ncbi:SMI1/KNR4 family protein [Krasilnikovia sp. MM14-A1259]|uniref:SMI1/KNR4 family protein n=1 Tax=Krasilnikovia sp. MM14-A1259 TaxID=3373539 RepID=UPI0037F9F6AB
MAGFDAGAAWATYLGKVGELSPESAGLLNPPADETAIAELEELAGHRLPESVKAGWRLHDGQECDEGPGVLLGLWWLPVAEVARQWTTWAQVRAGEDADGMRSLDLDQRSYPRLAIRRKYTLPGWIPLIAWPYESDYVGLDFDPGPEGRPGQVINFGQDQERKFVAAADFDGLLGWLAAEAAQDRLELDDDTVIHEDGNLIAALKQASGATFR